MFLRSCFLDHVPWTVFFVCYKIMDKHRIRLAADLDDCTDKVSPVSIQELLLQIKKLPGKRLFQYHHLSKGTFFIFIRLFFYAALYFFYIFMSYIFGLYIFGFQPSGTNKHHRTHLRCLDSKYIMFHHVILSFQRVAFFICQHNSSED